MGQCFGLRPNQSSRPSRFDYNPQRSWKYGDSHLMNQFKALSAESDDERSTKIKTQALSSDSEEEVFTSQPRRSEHLVFSEPEEDEDEGVGEIQKMTTVVNKGFQLLEDDSPILLHSHPLEDDDTIQLIDDNKDVT